MSKSKIIVRFTVFFVMFMFISTARKTRAYKCHLPSSSLCRRCNGVPSKKAPADICSKQDGPVKCNDHCIDSGYSFGKCRGVKFCNCHTIKCPGQ
ncbi:hypothetical protein AALP_AA8G341500 [Arabis alpina]|uniref:Knottin scorpion toxin-like domain-containing protein n=1 Tax=Arabis alpina TaxID=50452 RepID=A0A087GB97_ARAAL|nr:hypothetical protein AALP_AA8G341500 [Arabis alpina]